MSTARSLARFDLILFFSKRTLSSEKKMTFGKENLEILESIARCARMTFATKQAPIKIQISRSHVENIFREDFRFLA
jgi:hypothetical protein